ncbi:MAG: hypothetical protein EXR71_16285 [Myxococcales bacterium]|nr:hypothetical protein [Myxococcales bacterium]
MRRLSLLCAVFALCVPSPVFAGDEEQDAVDDAAKKKAEKKKKAAAPDDDDIPMGDGLGVDESDFKEESPETTPAPKRVEDEAPDAEEDELDFNDDDVDQDDIKFTEDDGQDSVQPRQPGEDTAQIYRDTQKKSKDMTPDEESLVWEEYVHKYPKTLFLKRIEDRQDDLSAIMFGDRVPDSDKGDRGLDAVQRELNFAVPFSLSSIDTRSRISGGIQWGFPSWFGGKIDAEYAFLRQMSAHVLLGRDFAGAVIQPGVKYALLKSSRTGTLLTSGVDIKLNTSPTFVAIRPMIGFGQRIRVGNGLDLSVQVSADLEARENSDIRWNAGLHGEYRPNEVIALFWEWSWDAKYLAHPDVDDSFRFFTTTFGIKFNAKKPQTEQGGGRIDAGVGAVYPYAANYWGFYAGGVDLMADYYL